MGWVLEAAHRLGAGIPELNTTDLDTAERIGAERARSTGIAVVEARTTLGPRRASAVSTGHGAAAGSQGCGGRQLGAGAAVTAD